MKLFRFGHPNLVRATCCNWTTSETFWLAETREQAEREIKELRKDEEPHGICGGCMAEMLVDGGYEITKVENDRTNSQVSEVSEVRDRKSVV